MPVNWSIESRNYRKLVWAVFNNSTFDNEAIQKALGDSKSPLYNFLICPSILTNLLTGVNAGSARTMITRIKNLDPDTLPPGEMEASPAKKGRPAKKPAAGNAKAATKNKAKEERSSEDDAAVEDKGKQTKKETTRANVGKRKNGTVNAVDALSGVDTAGEDGTAEKAPKRVRKAPAKKKAAKQDESTEEAAAESAGEVA